MKRKDIRAGVMYAEVSAYAKPSPVVFLEDGAATVWIEPFNRHRNASYIACSPSEKPHRARGWSGRSQGYAAVNGPADALEGLDCAAELAAFRVGGKPSREGLRFVLVFSLAKISGPYAEAVAEYEAVLAGERAAREKADAEAQVSDARMQAVIAGLSGFGIRSRVTATALGADLVGLDIENAERLLAVLREMNEG